MRIITIIINLFYGNPSIYVRVFIDISAFFFNILLSSNYAPLLPISLGFSLFFLDHRTLMESSRELA